MSFWLSFRLLPTPFQGNSKSPSLYLKHTLRSYHSNFRALLVQAYINLGTLTNRSSKETFQRHAKQSGAVEACWAHNPEVRGSKPRSAIFIFISKKKCDSFLQNPERTRIVLVRTREYSSFWVFQQYSVCTFVLVTSEIIISSTSCNINLVFLAWPPVPSKPQASSLFLIHAIKNYLKQRGLQKAQHSLCKLHSVKGQFNLFLKKVLPLLFIIARRITFSSVASLHYNNNSNKNALYFIGV